MSSRILELKKDLREKLISYCNSVVFRERPYAKDWREDFRSKIDNVIEFLEAGGGFEKIVSIKRIFDVRGSSGFKVNIICEFFSQEMPVSIVIDLREEGSLASDSIGYDISYEYMENLLLQIYPSVPYKDSGYYKDEIPECIRAGGFDAYYTRTQEFPVDDLYVYIHYKKFMDHFSDKIKCFLLNDNQKCLFLLDPKEPCVKENMVFLNGIKLYKIPEVNFDNELKKLKKIPYLKTYNFCERFLTRYISLELTPDNYLEIYATVDGFHYLFDILFYEYISHHSMIHHTFSDARIFQISCLPSVVGSCKNKVPSLMGSSGGDARFDTADYVE